MSITDTSNGRLCNQIIRNLALSLVAEKYDLYTEYSNFDIINNQLGIELFIGNKKYEKTETIRGSHNYMKLYNGLVKVDYNLNFMREYFQRGPITSILHRHLKNNKEKIMNKNKYKDRYNKNNDIFLHIRLTDASKFNVGIDYYCNCIDKIKYDNIYIASDNFKHEYITKIKELYPNVTLFDENEVDTIQFGSTCKHIILSHGTFSAVIGYLAFFSDVYFKNCNPWWCPIDIFIDKGFIAT